MSLLCACVNTGNDGFIYEQTGVRFTTKMGMTLQGRQGRNDGSQLQRFDRATGFHVTASAAMLL